MKISFSWYRITLKAITCPRQHACCRELLVSTFVAVLSIKLGVTTSHVNDASEVKDVLSTLKPVDRGGYYVQPCMEGTRENILGEIGGWLRDVNAPNVLWIK